MLKWGMRHDCLFFLEQRRRLRRLLAPLREHVRVESEDEVLLRGE